MKKKNNPPDDKFKVRCRKLGHLIYFSYCRAENKGLPCVKTMDCWYPYFNVEEFLRAELTDDEFAEVFARPQKPKVLSLVELLEKAQRNIKK